jgi:hypothetical protein
MSTMERLHDWDSWAEWESANNDLDPTEPDPFDYHNWWSGGWWVEPHPDMEGYTCSAGISHETYWYRPVPTAPVGLAAVTDLPVAPKRHSAEDPS